MNLYIQLHSSVIKQVFCASPVSGGVTALCWDPIQRVLFSGSSDHSIIMWDIGGRKGTAIELQGHKYVQSPSSCFYGRKAEGRSHIWKQKQPRGYSFHMPQACMCDSLWPIYNQNKLFKVSLSVWGPQASLKVCKGQRKKAQLPAVLNVLCESAPLLERKGPQTKTAAGKFLLLVVRFFRSPRGSIRLGQLVPFYSMLTGSFPSHL